MNDKEPEVMRILHEIREKRHEETKDLSDDDPNLSAELRPEAIET